MTLDSKKYIDVGRLMVLGPDPKWKEDVKKANYHKNGHPFVYSNALFAALGVIKTITGLSYKNLEGLCKESLGDANAPDHSTIHARIANLDISFDDSNRANIKTHDGKTIRFAIDSTGMTPYKRGESMHEKWRVKRGFVKLHVIVDESDGMVLSAKLTDDGKGSGDTLQLEELLDDALEKIELQKTGSTECVIQNSDKGQQHQDVELLGDGAYGSRKNVAACKKRNVSPILRLAVTSTTRGYGYGDDWSNLVREQFGCKTKGRRMYTNSLTKNEKYDNQKKWMKDTKYGKRWRVECVFSSIKRIQGEALWSRKIPYMKQEIRLRMWVHNVITKMGVHI